MVSIKTTQKAAAALVFVAWSAGTILLAQAPANPQAMQQQLAANAPQTRDLLLAHATEISAADAPYAANELAPLLRWVQGKRIVIVSEPTHGMHECRAENAKLVRFLIEKDGVRTVVLEVGYEGGAELNDFVQRGVGDLDHIVASDLGVIWNTTEEASMLLWIADWNRGHPGSRVRVEGMDIDATAPGGLALAKQLEAFHADPDLTSRVRTGAEAASRMKGPAREGASAADREASAAYDLALQDLVERWDTAGATSSLIRKPGEVPVRTAALRATMSVRDGRRAAELRASGPNGNDAGQRLREFSMARAALAFAADSTSPTVIVTHTVHLRPGRLAGDKVQTLGYHLARALGDRVFFLGEEYGTGSMRAMVPAPPGVTGMRPMHAATIDSPLPGSIAASLGDKGPLLIDMRDPRNGSRWSTWLESLQATHLYLAITYAPGEAALPNWTVPADAFDGLVYLPHVTALHPIGAPLYTR